MKAPRSPFLLIVQRIDEIQPAAPRNLDGLRIAAPGRGQHDLSAGAIDEVVQQRDQTGAGPHQTPSRIGLIRAIEDAVYVEENHPHAAVLSLTKCVLAGIGGSPRNVEVGSATFVHQQDEGTPR